MYVIERQYSFNPLLLLHVLLLLQVLKVAILAEKFAVDYTWYVDTILSLIRLAGDYVSEEVWYRVVQIVINREDVQGYAAKTCFEVNLPVCLIHITHIYMQLKNLHHWNLHHRVHTRTHARTHTHTHTQYNSSNSIHYHNDLNI